MTAPDPLYVFRVQGYLDGNWADWLGDLALGRNEDGITNLTGPVIDQPHLHGALTKFRDLGVTLIAVTPAGSPLTTTEKE